MAVAAVIALWMALRPPTGLYVNVTPSLPYGLYRATSAPPAPGRLARSCLPEEASALALARGYLTAGDCPHGTALVAKVVVAVGGDLVEVRPGGTLVNGVPLPASAPAPRDRGGRALPAAYGRHRLAEGEVWLYSGYHARSWDSRYYGPVPGSLLRGGLAAVWTRGAPYPPPGFLNGGPSSDAGPRSNPDAARADP